MDRLFIPFSGAIETKTDKPKGWFRAYASTFGNVDLGNDVVLPGAFDRTIAEHKTAGSMPAGYYEHNKLEPIMDWLSMEVDTKGLIMEGQLWVDSNVPRADQAHKMLHSKAPGKGFSIGFGHYAPPKTVTVEQKARRGLVSLRVDEVSATGKPMNQQASLVSIKSLLEEKKIITVRDAEEWLRDAVNLSATEAKTLIAAIRSSKDPERDAQDNQRKVLDDAMSKIKSLRKSLTSTTP